MSSGMILAVEEDPLASSKLVRGTLAVGHKGRVGSQCLYAYYSFCTDEKESQL